MSGVEPLAYYFGDWYPLTQSFAVPATPTRETLHLPFDMPVDDVLKASPRKAYPHYFPPTPVSIDNKALTDSTEYIRRYFLPPGGLEGATDQRPTGGYYRDRMARDLTGVYTPRTSGSQTIVSGAISTTVPTFQILNAQDHVYDALDAGFDGFFVDYISTGLTSNNHVWTVAVLEAALNAATTFTVSVMLDGNGAVTGNPTTCADRVYALYQRYSTIMAHNDAGELIVPIYRPEGTSSGFSTSHTLAEWTTFKTRLETLIGDSVALWMCYEQPWRSANQAPQFDSIAAVHGRWGDPDATNAGTSNIDNALAPQHCRDTYSKPWLHPVRPQDFRSKRQSGGVGAWWEAQNFTLLRNSWAAAIGGAADHVQVTTWSDLSEHSHIAPSVNNGGYALLDLNAYYLAWWKTGTAPPIIRDTLYLSHRIHTAANTSVTSTQTLFATKYGGTAARDKVEVLAFLASPGVIEIDVEGVVTSQSCPAGVSTILADLGVGEISAQLKRDGAVVTEVLSPQLVTATPVSQDLMYRTYSSRRPA